MEEGGKERYRNIMREIGAHYDHNTGTCRFTVWAPFRKSVTVRILSAGDRLVPMERDARGNWQAHVEDAGPGTRYLFRLDGETERPDPASHFQPENVHGPSAVIDHAAFHWGDDSWKGIPLPSMVMYELHIGTFTSEGTFDAAIPRLDNLRDLGVTAVELMPVAQFPGERNWGYDGVYPFAVQNSYGGPEGLKRFVNACHDRGLAAILDVVYNHLGPEGNYLRDFGPYFTDRYRTPWGQAINFDGPYSDDVRSYFIANALHWITQYHIDALRIDAIHGIFDCSARHFLQELGEIVHLHAQSVRREVYVIPESDLNDVRVIRPVEVGGYGLDAQWNDDFHHAIHTLLTGERTGYYEDFGKIDHLAKALREGFVYSGEYSSFRKRRHGSSSKDRPGHQFVVFSQNHDQVGNRMRGERLSMLAPFEALKLAAGAVLLAPNIPLLFMGEEYGEDTPFLYFVDHSDLGLIEAVRMGRKDEFKHFRWEGEPPDPQDERTFLASKINWVERGQGKHAVLLEFYRTLIKLRREVPALSELDRNRLAVSAVADSRVITLRQWNGLGTSHAYGIFNFETNDINITVSAPEGRWRKLVDSADKAWNGPGTMTPTVVHSGDGVTMRGQSVALFLYKEER
jgi:maltooligosyltrehalose trehalohydrolase